MSKLRIRGSFGVVVCTLVGCAGRSSDGNDADAAVSVGGSGPITSAGGMLGSGGSHGSGGSTTGVGGGPSAGGQSTTGGSLTSAGGTGAVQGGTGGNRSDDELCEWGSYDTDQTDDELTCEEWTECQPGQYLADQGGFWEDNLCEPCSNGTFSAAVNERRCEEWHRCKLGEQVAVVPSIVSDRSCEPAELFAPYPGAALGLALTGEGPRLLVVEDKYPFPPEAFVASYSLAGQSVGNVSTGGANTGADDVVLAMASVGDEVFVVGLTPSGLAAPGYVRKISKSGTIEWETELGSATDYFDAVAARAGGDLYVVAEVYENGEGPARIQLYALDPADGSLSNPTLEGNPRGSPLDIEVAANGHIYVAGVTSAFSSAYPSATIMEFDAAGTLIAERALSDSDWLAQLAPDESGGVYALGTQGPQRLYHLDTGGALLSTVELGTNDWAMEAMTSTPDGVLVLGRALKNPVLVTTDPRGEVTATEVLEDIEAPQNFVGIRRAPEGTVFVAGTNVTLGGVDPVAFVAPWPD